MNNENINGEKEKKEKKITELKGRNGAHLMTVHVLSPARSLSVFYLVFLGFFDN